jgi:hypothetical protein
MADFWDSVVDNADRTVRLKEKMWHKTSPEFLIFEKSLVFRVQNHSYLIFMKSSLENNINL